MNRPTPPSWHAREYHLLRCAARVRLTPAESFDLTRLFQADFHWDFVLAAGRRHGILPLLHLHLRDVHAVPQAVRDQLQAHARANAARNLLLSGELLQLLRLFAADGVTALPFKGPTLAVQAYGNLALREFGDLDLLVPEAELPRAKALLQERGYRVQYPFSPRQEAAYVRTIRQLPMRREDGCIVELHAALAPRSFCFPLDTAQLWRRRVAVALLGQSAPAPCPEDLLLILCMHGAKHLWNNLGWICDVAELLRACPGIDWPATRRRARELRARRLLDLALDLAREVLGAPAPVPAADGVVGGLRRRVVRELFAEEERSSDGLASAGFHWQVRERLGDGVQYCLSLLLEPTPGDWTAGGRLSWLPLGDYRRRLFRLAGKYAQAAYHGVIRRLFPPKPASPG
jgi:hypothetical protein